MFFIYFLKFFLFFEIFFLFFEIFLFLNFFFIFIYKMTELKKMTLRELKALAKKRNLRGYSRLRKADLIHLLNPARPIPAPRTRRPKPIPAPRPTLLDRRVPNITVPILKPEVVTAKKPSTIGKVVERLLPQLMIGLIGYVIQEIKSKRRFLPKWRPSNKG